MTLNFSTAEELDTQKNKIAKERTRKLTQDRQEPRGDTKLAQTEGLKTIRRSSKKRSNVIAIDDDQVIDLRRVRKAGDLLSVDELEEMESWYD